MTSYISGQNDQRQCFININHFHHYQVTFNMGNTAAPEKPHLATLYEEDGISGLSLEKLQTFDRFRLN